MEYKSKNNKIISEKDKKNTKLSEDTFKGLISNFSKKSIISKFRNDESITNKKEVKENDIIKNIKKDKLQQQNEFNKMGLKRTSKFFSKIMKHEKISQSKLIENKTRFENKTNFKIKKNKISSNRKLSINNNLNDLIKNHYEKYKVNENNYFQLEQTKYNDKLLNKKVNKIKNNKLMSKTNKFIPIKIKERKKFNSKQFNKNSLKLFSLNNKDFLKNINHNESNITTKEDRIKKINGEHNFNHVNKIITFLDKDKKLSNNRDKIRNKLKKFNKTTQDNPKISNLKKFIENNVDLNDSINNYIVGRLLGDGCISKVYLSINKLTDEKFALKFINKKSLLNHDKFLYLKNEVEALNSLKNDNIIKLHKCINDTDNIILILEYCSSTTLYDYLKLIKKIEIIELKIIIKNIALTINYIHNKNYNHGDIKLENILITKDNKIKIIDFGFSSNLVNNKYVNYYWGTPHYMSPEIIKQSPYLGKKVDLWAFGILIYKLSTGVYLLNGDNNKEIFNKIKNFNSSILINKIIKDKNKDYLLDIIFKLLKKIPEDRISTEELLSHKLFIN